MISILFILSISLPYLDIKLINLLTENNEIHIYCFASEFVASEQDESSEFSVRHSGADLLSHICNLGKEKAFKFFFSPIFIEELNQFSSFNSTCVSTTVLSARTILKMEGILWTLGSMGAAYMRLIKLDDKYNRRAREYSENTTSVEQMEVSDCKRFYSYFYDLFRFYE